MGNHEDMLLEYIDGYGISWAYNGYEETLKSYDNHMEDLRSDLAWMRKLPLYHEDDSCIYVHAGIKPDVKMENQFKNDLLWTREPFYYGHDAEIKENKRVIFGHTPTQLINNGTSPIMINGNVATDTGCVFGGCLTALMIDGDTIEYVQVKEGGTCNE